MKAIKNDRKWKNLIFLTYLCFLIGFFLLIGGLLSDEVWHKAFLISTGIYYVLFGFIGVIKKMFLDLEYCIREKLR